MDDNSDGEHNASENESSCMGHFVRHQLVTVTSSMYMILTLATEEENCFSDLRFSMEISGQ
jgi:hypothetical protein